MSTTSTADIERIVREVMAQLGITAPTAADRGAAAAVDSSAVDSSAARSAGVCIDARVITLEAIRDHLHDAKQLMVPPGALITPAVEDLLHRKGVAIVRGRAAVQNGRPRLLLVAGRTRHDSAATIQMLTQEGIDVQADSSECMIASCDKLAAAVAQGQSLGLLWTRHTAVGLCLANRHAGVRAVLATNVTLTAAAVSAVGANVLVVDPTVGTAYEKKRILRDFCLGGIRNCPEELTARLEGKGA